MTYMILPGTPLSKTLDKIWAEEFLDGWHNKKISVMPIDELLRDVNIEYCTQPKKTFTDSWFVVKQNKVKGEWLIKGNIGEEIVCRPILIIQKGSEYEDVLTNLGDTEFDRWNYLGKEVCLTEARKLVAEHREFKQADVAVRLAVGISTTLKELTK